MRDHFTRHYVHAGRHIFLTYLLRRCNSPATRYMETCTWNRVHAITSHCATSQAVLPTDTRLLGRIKVQFEYSKGNPLKTIEGSEGDSLLDMAHEYNIDLEGVYARIHRCR